jgi:hypothetical protein
MKQKKPERKATRGEIQRTVNRLYALSIALLRAETAFDKYYEEATKLFASGRTDDELVEGIPGAVAKLQNNTLIRAGSLMSVYLGLLYAVVEGCRKWGFTHASVDALLSSPFVKDLKDHRNAIFHVSEATDPRVMQWGERPDRIEWAKQLAVRLRALLLQLHERLAEKIAVQVQPKTE